MKLERSGSGWVLMELVDIIGMPRQSTLNHVPNVCTDLALRHSDRFSLSILHSCLRLPVAVLASSVS